MKKEETGLELTDDGDENREFRSDVATTEAGRHRGSVAAWQRGSEGVLPPSGLRFSSR